MLLSGNRITREVKAGNIVIEPFDPACINPNSYNCRLSPDILVYHPNTLDMAIENACYHGRISKEGMVLLPGQLVLGKTVEYIESPKYVPILDGRSSVARLGLEMHISAGFCDRFFRGHLTFEMTVVLPLRIYAGVAVAQISFHEVDDEGPLYAGKYKNTRGYPPMPSGLWREFNK